MQFLDIILFKRNKWFAVVFWRSCQFVVVFFCFPFSLCFIDKALRLKYRYKETVIRGKPYVSSSGQCSNKAVHHQEEHEQLSVFP